MRSFFLCIYPLLSLIAAQDLYSLPFGDRMVEESAVSIARLSVELQRDSGFPARNFQILVVSRTIPGHPWEGR